MIHWLKRYLLITDSLIYSLLILYPDRFLPMPGKPVSLPRSCTPCHDDDFMGISTSESTIPLLALLTEARAGLTSVILGYIMRTLE